MKLKLLAGIIAALLSQHAYSGSSDVSKIFDIETLKARGLSADIADFFKDEKRFMKGKNQVMLFVNDIKIGRTQISFDEIGNACMDADFFSRANIILPAANKADLCIDLKVIYPQAVIRLRPGKDEIALILPQSALRTGQEVNLAEGFVTGGTAALFNYDLLYMKRNSGASDNTTIQANTEAGLNINDWSLRSRQTYSSSQGKSQFSHLNAYAQKSLPDYKSIFQVGQINAANTMFDAPPLLGVQLFPEGALLRQAGSRVVVDGIAQSEARVEVRQGGALIYSTLVPPGPFSLTGLTLNNANTNLDVTVIEGNGAQRSFVVFASSFAIGYIPQEKSFSVALGKPWRYGGGADDSSTSNWLATARVDLPLGSSASVATGALMSDRYYSAGVQYDVAPNRSVTMGIANLFAFVPASGETGMQTTLTAAAQIYGGLSIDALYAYRTDKYRTFSDTLRNEDRLHKLPYDPVLDQNDTGRRQMNLNLNYNHPMIGGIGLGFSQMSGGVDATSRRLSVRWARSIVKATVSVSVDRTTGANKDLLAYANINIPFGSGSLTASTSRNDRRQVARVNYSDRINEYASYRVSADTDSDKRQIGTSANVSLLPKYAQLNLGMSRYGSGSTSYSGYLSGGLVAHQNGVTFSPYAVRDTFALMSVPGISGVKIQTPQGPVWTDAAGMAVAPYMPAYSEARLELVTKSLPKNADIKNGIQVVGLSRGAVSNVVFEVIRSRRVLLKIMDEQGQAMSKGVSVFNEENQWITSVGANGTVFLTGDQLASSIRLTNLAGRSCVVNAELPAQPTTESFYENAESVCQSAN